MRLIADILRQAEPANRLDYAKKPRKLSSAEAINAVTTELRSVLVLFHDQSSMKIKTTGTAAVSPGSKVKSVHEQLRIQRSNAWKECNRRLYSHYRAIAPQLSDSFSEMEPLFLAAICGCRAGLFRDALHEIYTPRIQRGNASFAASVLGARGAVLSVLAHFFEHGSWGSLAETGVEGQSLTPEDHLFILMQAALYLTVTRGFAAPEARTCYERVESLSHSLNRPLLLYSALLSQ
jgi:hypothetical protein